MNNLLSNDNSSMNCEQKSGTASRFSFDKKKDSDLNTSKVKILNFQSHITSILIRLKKNFVNSKKWITLLVCLIDSFLLSFAYGSINIRHKVCSTTKYSI